METVQLRNNNPQNKHNPYDLQSYGLEKEANFVYEGSFRPSNRSYSYVKLEVGTTEPRTPFQIMNLLSHHTDHIVSIGIKLSDKSVLERILIESFKNSKEKILATDLLNLLKGEATNRGWNLRISSSVQLGKRMARCRSELTFQGIHFVKKHTRRGELYQFGETSDEHTSHTLPRESTNLEPDG